MDCRLEIVLLSVCTSLSFIIALYIIPNRLPRNDPYTIKVRTTSVCLSISVSLYILGRYKDLDELRLDYLFSQHFLVFVMQFIPIIIFFRNLVDDPFIQYSNLFNLVVIRDYLLAPITEEMSYRYILLKILHPCFSEMLFCLISSFLFGFSHFHHYLLDLDHKRCLVSTCSQFMITFLFGLFASSIYLKSQYIIAPIVCHSICNFLGIPDLNYLASSKILSCSTILTFTLGVYVLIIF